MTQDELVDLFKRWRKPIRKWLSHRPNIRHFDLDDIAQETFMRLLRYPTDEVLACPQAYLFRIAHNVAIEWQERSCRREPHDDGWLEMLVDDETQQPENAVAIQSETLFVSRAVEQLPTRARELVLLHINEGLTYKQIAARKHITYRMVLRDLTKAYSQLRIGLHE